MKNKKSFTKFLVLVAIMLLCLAQTFPKNSKAPQPAGSAPAGVADGGSAETNGGSTANGPSFVKLNSRFAAVNENAGYARYLEHNQRTAREDLELNLAGFEDVQVYTNEESGGHYITYSGHTVYRGRYPSGYYWGKSPDEPFLFFISGSQPIPLKDEYSCSYVNSFIRNTGANLYVEGEALRIYGVYSQEDVEEFHQHYEAGQAVLRGEMPAQKGQLVLDGRLIPCT